MAYDLIIIGGGATGTAIFRDLSLRGFKTALIEKSKLATGTTNNSHHNLLGGMRYIIKDPIIAQECALENKILSIIMPKGVGKRKNYFVGFKNEYTTKALEEAERRGVIYRKINLKQAFEEIPSLNKSLDLIVETEDKNIDVIKFCYLNCKSAVNAGGELFEKTSIFNIKKKYLIETNRGVLESKGIINATGPWINSIANKIGVNIPIIYNQGTIIVQQTLSPKALQYFHEPSDGDAYMVQGEEGWLGTTSTNIENPKNAYPEKWAEKYLLDRFSIILPEIAKQKTTRKFVGVRPLIKPEKTMGSRNISRSFQLFENPDNFYHIIGGKLTLARLIAEKASDKIGEKFGLKTECKTSKEKLE